MIDEPAVDSDAKVLPPVQDAGILLTDEELLHLDDAELAQHAEIVMNALKHVMMALEQCLLFISKKEKAKEDARGGVEQEEQVYTFVADFAQNTFPTQLQGRSTGSHILLLTFECISIQYPGWK